MEEELPSDIQLALQIRLEQLESALIADVRKIEQDASDKHTLVYRHLN